jgi:hypothetical protein
VEFSRELRNDVLAGDITLSVRLWRRPRVKQGGRYRVGPGEIEVDAIELVPFAAITRRDVRRAGEPDRETLRQRAAHAGPIDEDTLVYRIEFHAVNSADLATRRRRGFSAPPPCRTIGFLAHVPIAAGARGRPHPVARPCDSGIDVDWR